MNKDVFESNGELSTFLSEIVGFKCALGVSSKRKWGKSEQEEGRFYQIIANNDFYYWYNIERSDYQFFVTPELAALHFIRYYQYWLKKGKPNPY